ncbi:MAG: hypothetical protein VKK59_07605 [Vampirovibrionales bacterium]|nr:hypothetical protein [Vampirovibrionales bacterium]
MRITLSHIRPDGIHALVDWPCPAMPGQILKLEGGNDIAYTEVLCINGLQQDASRQEISLKLLSGKPSMTQRLATVLTREQLIDDVKAHHQRLYPNEPTTFLNNDLPLSMDALGGLTIISTPDAQSLSACSPALLKAFCNIAQPLVIDTSGQLKHLTDFKHLRLGHSVFKNDSKPSTSSVDLPSAQLSIDLLGIEFLLTSIPAFFPPSLREDVLKTLATILPSEAGFLSIEQLLEPARLSGLLSQLPSAGRSPLIRLLHEGASLGLFAKTPNDVFLPNLLEEPTIVDLSELRPSWRPWCLEALLQTCYQTLCHRPAQAKPILLVMVHPEYLGSGLQQWRFLFESQHISQVLIVHDRTNLIALKHQTTTHMALTAQHSLKVCGQLTHQLPILIHLEPAPFSNLPLAEYQKNRTTGGPTHTKPQPEPESQNDTIGTPPDDAFICKLEGDTLLGDDPGFMPDTFLEPPQALLADDIEDFTPSTYHLAPDLADNAPSSAAHQIAQESIIRGSSGDSTPLIPTEYELTSPDVLLSNSHQEISPGWLDFDLPLPGDPDKSHAPKLDVSTFEPDANQITLPSAPMASQRFQPEAEPVVSDWDFSKSGADIPNPLPQAAWEVPQQASSVDNAHHDGGLLGFGTLMHDALTAGSSLSVCPEADFLLNDPLLSTAEQPQNFLNPDLLIPQGLLTTHEAEMPLAPRADDLITDVLQIAPPPGIDFSHLPSEQPTPPLEGAPTPKNPEPYTVNHEASGEAASLSQALVNFMQGERVQHPQYGQGVVQSIIDMGNRTILNIQFDEAGKRLLDPNLSPLTKMTETND